MEEAYVHIFGTGEKKKKTIVMVDAYRQRREENVDQEGK